MSVYNGEKFLKEAIESILNQSYKSLEFIIIDDASKDDSLNILKSYSDPRIKILINTNNLGLTSSLNLGISIAKGKYIARMDADDISLVNRIEKQVLFLEENQHISFCGSNILYIEDSLKLNYFPENHDEIKFEMIGQNPFAHPTMMWRREDFLTKELIYDEKFKVAQDYELWSRAIVALRGANLRDRLIKYRTHENRVSEKKAEEVTKNVSIIQRNYLQKFQITLNENNYSHHHAVFGCGFRQYREASFVEDVDKYMMLFVEHNLRTLFFKEHILLKKWRDIFFGSMLYQYNLRIMVIGLKSPINRLVKIPILLKIRFVIKCIINYSPKYYQ